MVRHQPTSSNLGCPISCPSRPSFGLSVVDVSLRHRHVKLELKQALFYFLTRESLPCPELQFLKSNNKGKPSTMDDATFQSLQEALAHHNEWDGRNIMLSVNESPELEELVEIDLAQCIGNANNQLTPHSKASQPSFSHMVRVFMKRPFQCFDISTFDISTFRHSYTSVFPHFDVPTFRHSDISMIRHFDIPTFRHFATSSSPQSSTGFQITSTQIPQSSD
jgi:hypothetical protein